MSGPGRLSLSWLICAYNEEKTIGAKMENILAVDRADLAREIIVVDDHSCDRTVEIISEYARRCPKIAVLKNGYKEGKWGALRTGLAYARGEVVCITDADVLFQEDTLENALKLFSDPLVGVVTGNQKNILVRGEREGAPFISFYERCINFFRTLESRLDSTVSCHGQCLFVRKAGLELPEQGVMADDVFMAISARRKGYRAIFCRDAYYIEKMPRLTSRDTKRIFQRRARAIAEVMLKNIDLLFNPRYQRFGWICFPVEFFLYLVFPFLLVFCLSAFILWSLYYSHTYLFVSLGIFCLIGHKLLLMAGFQMAATVSYILNPGQNKARWARDRG